MTALLLRTHSAVQFSTPKWGNSPTALFWTWWALNTSIHDNFKNIRKYTIFYNYIYNSIYNSVDIKV